MGLIGAAGLTTEAERRPYPASGKRSSLLCAGGIWLGMRAGEVDSYRRREATAASTPVPVACGSAGGVPAAGGCGRGLLSVSAGGGRLRQGEPMTESRWHDSAAIGEGGGRRRVLAAARARRCMRASSTRFRRRQLQEDGGAGMRIWADSFGIGNHGVRYPCICLQEKKPSAKAGNRSNRTIAITASRLIDRLYKG
uniref:Uncharacterized protein n=1 Tax=Oryza sativa subsp. japonica TaxID=39947 RepID=Q6H6C6_ORYSJ|nr:hypothetical protein [Oryza sativa Japonica Group]